MPPVTVVRGADALVEDRAEDDSRKAEVPVITSIRLQEAENGHLV